MPGQMRLFAVVNTPDGPGNVVGEEGDFVEVALNKNLEPLGAVEETDEGTVWYRKSDCRLAE